MLCFSFNTFRYEFKNSFFLVSEFPKMPLSKSLETLEELMLYGSSLQIICQIQGVDDLLRMVFINAIISTRIVYSLRDCNPLLLWSCRSWSNIFFNLHFAVCWQVPSSLQMFKSNEEREYNCVFEICWFASL